MIDIEAIKSRADIVAIVRERCEKVQKSGVDYKALCPFHEEKTPSFTVYLKPDQHYFCFGCQAKGDVITLVQQLDGITFQEAARKLAERYGVPVNGAKQVKRESPKEAREVFARFGKKRVWELDRWMPHHKFLMSRPDLIAEFAKRGIAEATLAQFRIGALGDGKKICRGHEEEMGDLVEKPWFGFPYIYGEQVRLVKWRSLFSAGKKFIRPSAMEDCLFVGDPRPDKKESVVLVEGEMDCLSIAQLGGYRVASLPSGAKSKLSVETMKYLLGHKRIFLCLDNDAEGKTTLRRLLQELPAEKTSVVTIPEKFKDANKLLVSSGSMEKFRAKMTELMAKAQLPSAVSFSDLDDAFEQYLALRDGGAEGAFFAAPWDNVNAMADIEPGDVFVVASSRTGQGKTTYAVQVALHNAIKLGRTVGYYTAEMDPVRELVPMLAAQLTWSDRNLFKANPQYAREAVEKAREMCSGIDFYFGYDSEAENWVQHQTVLEMAVRRLGIEHLWIDHLDFIIRDSDWRRAMAQKAMAMKWLKTGLAMKYGVAVGVLRQTVKADQKSRQKGKDSADIYDIPGGAEGITDANHVFMINRKKLQDLKEGSKDVYSDEATIIKGKGRSGGTTFTKLMLAGKYARFDKVGHGDEWPEGRE